MARDLLMEDTEDELECCTFRVPANIVVMTSNSPTRLEVTMHQQGNNNEDTTMDDARFECDVRNPCQCGVVMRYIRLLIDPSENIAQVELKFTAGTCKQTGENLEDSEIIENENEDEVCKIKEYQDEDEDEEEGCEENERTKNAREDTATNTTQSNGEPPLGQWSSQEYYNNNNNEEDSDTSSISVIYGKR
jgi:hypothetical protein